MTVLALGIVLGLLVGLLRGGSLLALERLRLRSSWLVIAALALQVVLFSGPAPVRAALAPVLGPAYVLSFLLLLASLAANLAVPGIPVVMVGVALNTLAVAVNGGLMPSVVADDPRAASTLAPTSNVAPMTDQARLPFLGDVITLPGLPGHAASVGDVVVGLGLAYLLQAALVDRPVHNAES